ncbi:MAG: hypothetical protein MUO97_10945, partial [Dehalococcoidia bacterium]|nr:hypothetical protein [Dehalococcoidia bacterium]
MHIIYTTRYLLWESEARGELFSKIEYAPIKDERLAGSIPKLGVTEAVSILDKLRSERNEIGSCFNTKSRLTNNNVFYRRGGLYWKVFVDFVTGSSEEKIINIIAGIDPRSIIAALSSNLWFWYFTSTSDCRHLGRRDIDTFPFDPREMSPPLYAELCKLGQEYVLDLRRHAGIEVRVYKGNKSVECLSFIVKEAKPIIDKIDRLLAQHYGFTEEELDFIINYDIKYRMGKDSDEQEES